MARAAASVSPLLTVRGHAGNQIAASIRFVVSGCECRLRPTTHTTADTAANPTMASSTKRDWQVRQPCVEATAVCALASRHRARFFYAVPNHTADYALEHPAARSHQITSSQGGFWAPIRLATHHIKDRGVDSSDENGDFVHGQ
jgi:hypothetical protein